MNQPYIALLGRFHIGIDSEQPIGGLDGQKCRDLLGYILLQRRTPQQREYLASLFWPDTPAHTARKYLRHHLWRIQTTLTENEIVPFLEVNDEDVGVVPAAEIFLDVQELEQAFWATRDRPADRLEAKHYDQLVAAVGKYGGELLPHSYDDWCIVERERLQSIYLILLDRLMAYCESNQMYEEGLIYGHRVLRIDQARERTHRRLMALYYRSGDRTGALRQFHHCASILERELGVSSSQKTVDLYNMIRDDVGAISDAPELVSSRPAVGGGANVDLAQDLNEIDTRLSHLQRAIKTYLQHRI